MKWFFKDRHGAGLGVVTKTAEAGGKLGTSENSALRPAGWKDVWREVQGFGAGLVCGGSLDLEFVLLVCITFLLTDLYILRLVDQSCPALRNSMDFSLPGSSVHGDSLGRNIGVGGHALLQGIFPTQGLNPGLLYCRWIVYQLSHQGSPGIPKWVVYPFSRESSQPRNQTKVSCTVGGFFTN